MLDRMNVELAEERVLVLPEQFGEEIAETRAWVKRLDAFGTMAKVSGLLNRPKDQEFELVYRERRLQPFWRLEATAISAYERSREYVIKVAPGVTTVQIAGDDRPTPNGAFTLTGLESCREEQHRSFLFDGLTKALEPDLAGYLTTEAAPSNPDELVAIAAAGTIVVPPQVKSSVIVRETVAGMMGRIDADRVLEESVRISAVDLVYRPVYAFRYRRAGKEAVVEVDAMTGVARAGGATFERYLGKVLDPAFLFDVTVETANIFLPGATLVKVLVNKGLEMRKRSAVSASMPLRPRLADRRFHGVGEDARRVPAGLSARPMVRAAGLATGAVERAPPARRAHRC